ncbi:ABC-transporter extracellular N-terminal-domain-containing protein [Aspergillus candidus]|uniref:ABC-transporter extracellular N-terminal-domain-containing protein n=1 Tax=Aspergillus candidus TaxID=41067 RepID=A0A2I2FHA5_ASPCN|nr:ABC-transporter extracellular N-terminal-domain-containing protein [Aspergillus candidus]PLB40011.1 ABC-transporter extracellular N-terminal-domain-containing protein [Aspergillus candidus]
MSAPSTCGPNGNRELKCAEDSISSFDVREAEILKLTRRFTEQSHGSSAAQNPFAAEPGSTLDPNGANFNARAWCKAMLQVSTEDGQAHLPRSLGVAFSNLNVHGFGSDTYFKKSVGNVWLEAVGLARRLMGRRKRKINILQNLDGLVEAGEMLVVLGPPGSGCTTFLKTIAERRTAFTSIRIQTLITKV